MGNFYGLIGEKLGHSISPKIHLGIFKKLKIDGVYSLFEIKKENLSDAVRGLKALGCTGVNVTIPYKVEVMKFLDEISEEAEKIGAVNTLVFKDGIKGYNTDYYGFGCTLKREGIEVQGKSVVILGTGGAAKAVLQYLIDNNTKDITFASGNPVDAKEKIKGHNIISYSELKHIEKKDIIINCTPCGMYPKIDASPVDIQVLEKFSVAVDLIYNPIETLLLKNAKRSGLVTANGLYMLVAQAAAAEELWQDTKFSSEFIDELYEAVKGGI